MESIPVLPETGFLRLRQILGDARTGVPGIIPIGTTAWYAGIRKGKYPKPVKIGPRMSAWRAEDIRKLVEDLGAQLPRQ